MGEISCSDGSNGQRIVPCIPHAMRSKEWVVPSIRKRFILSGYTRAGGFPTKKGVLLCDAKQGSSAVLILVRR